MTEEQTAWGNEKPETATTSEGRVKPNTGISSDLKKPNTSVGPSHDRDDAVITILEENLFSNVVEESSSHEEQSSSLEEEPILRRFSRADTLQT